MYLDTNAELQICKLFSDVNLCICILHYLAHSMPSIRELLPFVTRLATSWYELGAMLLEVKKAGHLNLIQTTHGSDAKRCCLAMFQYWMNTDPKATWHHLVTALRSPGVEMSAVASEIEGNFKGKV